MMKISPVGYSYNQARKASFGKIEDNLPNNQEIAKHFGLPEEEITPLVNKVREITATADDELKKYAGSEDDVIGVSLENLPDNRNYDPTIMITYWTKCKDGFYIKDDDSDKWVRYKDFNSFKDNNPRYSACNWSCSYNHLLQDPNLTETKEHLSKCIDISKKTK